MSNKELRAPFRRIVTGHDAQGRAVILEAAPPPNNGTRIRVLEVPPEDPSIAKLTPEQARAHLAEVAADAASHSGSGSKPAFMHRTETIGYGIVLDGETTLILEEGETVVRASNIVIQRGTNNGWANRGKVPCRIAFVLIDGRFDAELAP